MTRSVVEELLVSEKNVGRGRVCRWYLQGIDSMFRTVFNYQTPLRSQSGDLFTLSCVKDTLLLKEERSYMCHI